jgi:hypothetical protein
MKYSAFALAALAAAGMASAQTKWVPLSGAQAKQTKATPAPAPTTQPAKAETMRDPAQSNAQVVAQTIAQPTAPAAMAPGARNRPLQITCLGAGTANKFAVVSGSSSGSFSGFAGTTMISGNVSGSSSTLIPRDRDFADQVDIRLFSGDDRIRLPRTMLPPIHGGDAGWFKLKHVVADARSIRASAAINFMNNPKIYIDRVTGTISISGRAGDYSGQCEMIDASAAPKF